MESERKENVAVEVPVVLHSHTWCIVCRGNFAENPAEIWDIGVLVVLLRSIGLSFHAAQNHRKVDVKRYLSTSSPKPQAG